MAIALKNVKMKLTKMKLTKMKLTNLFYKDKFVTDGTMGSYKRTPTTLLEIIKGIIAIASVMGFTYLLLTIASITG